jgi:hypothetical protein
VKTFWKQIDAGNEYGAAQNPNGLPTNVPVAAMMAERMITRYVLIRSTPPGRFWRRSASASCLLSGEV